jgi:type III restriction enzyme
VVETFFEQLILNSPYEIPTRHDDLDEEGRPTNAPLIQGGRLVRSMNIGPAGAPCHKNGTGVR